MLLRNCVADHPKHILGNLRETLDALESNLEGTSPEKLDQSIEAADEIVRKLKALRATAASFAAEQREEETGHHFAPDVTANLQKREFVVLALEELGLPASPAIVSTFIKQRWGADVHATQFASIRKGDERAWSRGRRARPLIVPALSAHNLAPRQRACALSVWPADLRIIGGLSERADGLQLLLTAASRMKKKPEDAWYTLFHRLAADFHFTRAGTDVDGVKKSAEIELKAIAGRDAEERKAAAERLLRLPESIQLFGRPLGFDVLVGGKHA
jgi:hypothetical protein